MRKNKPRSKWWWYKRYRKAYKCHGLNATRRETWRDAKVSQKDMPIPQQWDLLPLKKYGIGG